MNKLLTGIVVGIVLLLILSGGFGIKKYKARGPAARPRPWQSADAAVARMRPAEIVALRSAAARAGGGRVSRYKKDWSQMPAGGIIFLLIMGGGLYYLYKRNRKLVEGLEDKDNENKSGGCES